MTGSPGGQVLRIIPQIAPWQNYTKQNANVKLFFGAGGGLRLVVRRH
jgi:hypothetical protein